MSDKLNDIINELEDETDGTLEELEEGLMIEMDEDDLEEVAGGKKHSYIVGKNNTNIRKGPGLKYKSIGTMYAGDTLRYTHESARDERGVKWYKVELNGGRTGWVSKRNTRKEKLD